MTTSIRPFAGTEKEVDQLVLGLVTVPIQACSAEIISAVSVGVELLVMNENQKSVPCVDEFCAKQETVKTKLKKNNSFLILNY